MVKEVLMTMAEAVEINGNYIVFWRKGQKDAARVISSDKEKEEVTFELISGPDKGKVRTANYDPVQQVDVYDEESVVLAVMQK